jgi:4'-phosphopantetheinyl transferase EntD
MAIPEHPTIAEILDVLKRIFPMRCGASVERTEAASLSDLFPEEAAAVERAVPKRQREFAAGRRAARHALAQLGKPRSPIAMNTDRSPKWPADIVGSLSHCTDFAVAVVACRSQVKALGVDVETSGEVGAELWNSLFVPEEIEFLKRCSSEQDRRMWATVLFSAKESFFKLQYPLTSKWVDFQAARITLNCESQTFSLELLQKDVSPALPGDVFFGQFGFADHLTLTGLWLPS